MLYMVTFTINIPQMFAYIPYMDPMGTVESHLAHENCRTLVDEPRDLRVLCSQDT